MGEKFKSIIIAERENLPLDVKLGRKKAYLEIGFGNGEFLAYMAREDRESSWWGIEMSRSCVLRAQRRIEREGLSNARILYGDARFFLRKCLAGESLDGIYMNFPCPWPKNRHSKNRVSSGSFPSEVARVLKKGGFFELFTDEEWYGLEVRGGMIAHPYLEESSWQVDPIRPIRTKYERRWLEMGKNIYRSKVEKNMCAAGEDPHYLGRAQDVHVRVQRRGKAGSVLKDLFGREGKDGSSLWIYKRSY
ncbi:MAG: tRNA (guanosine(46)-N7)-methyltransferase TrmB, partial [Synergistaceae bacterium]|nr:tRNA (guanosine(46)-N7)-methyltransferase TrmB [Synergistaceae bacterium]